MTRYAVYYAPEPDHPLWAAGCDWLGRDPAVSDTASGTPRPHTVEPRRYGFHTTLKPPMALRGEAAAFLDAVAALAATWPRFPMPPLEVRTLGRFVALRPSVDVDEAHPLRRLADACVRDLDAWRLPQPRTAEPSLSDTQRALQDRWGYAHVFAHWRFHLTLSDSVEDGLVPGLVDDARRHFADALRQPLDCESLCVFTEPADGAPFRLTHRFPLAR